MHQGRAAGDGQGPDGRDRDSSRVANNATLDGRIEVGGDCAAVGEGVSADGQSARAKAVARVEQQHPAGQVVERAAGQGKHGAVVAAGIGELHQTAVVQRPRHGQNRGLGLAIGILDLDEPSGLICDGAG